MKSTLDSLQNDFLREFFDRESSFYLTGGAALVGFYLGHRKTQDLDLFTLEDEIADGAKIVRETANSLGATIESIITAPEFRRILVKRGDEAVIVDLVRESVFQIEPDKREINGIRIDSPEEILANKLCALLSRSEIRDLIDVRELEKAGFDLETALQVAAKKDSGLTAAQLAWVLSQINIGDDAQLPNNISSRELRAYSIELIDKLKRFAFPK